jgi:hypothetical protein
MYDRRGVTCHKTNCRTEFHKHSIKVSFVFRRSQGVIIKAEVGCCECFDSCAYPVEVNVIRQQATSAAFNVTPSPTAVQQQSNSRNIFITT